MPASSYLIVSDPAWLIVHGDLQLDQVTDPTDRADGHAMRRVKSASTHVARGDLGGHGGRWQAQTSGSDGRRL